MVIRLAPGAQPSALHLAEVQLYDALGNQIPPRTLTASMSSTTTLDGVGQWAQRCVDGDTTGIVNGTRNLCYANPSDTNPNLTIGYSCPSGRTLGSLSRVVVYNRQDCCQEQLVSYMVEFRAVSINGSGSGHGGNTTVEVDPSVSQYRFADAGTQRIYTINVSGLGPGERGRGLGETRGECHSSSSSSRACRRV